MSFVDWIDQPSMELFESDVGISQSSFLTYCFYLLKSL